jgi:hypothetical protein
VGVGVGVAVGGGVVVGGVVAVGAVVATWTMPTGGAARVAADVTCAMLATGTGGGLPQAVLIRTTSTNPKLMSFIVIPPVWQLAPA